MQEQLNRCKVLSDMLYDNTQKCLDEINRVDGRYFASMPGINESKTALTKQTQLLRGELLKLQQALEAL